MTEDSNGSGPSPLRGKLDLDVYTVADLHERLGFKRQTIQNWIKTGQLRSVDFGGSAGNKVLHEWLMDFMETRARGGRQEAPRPAAGAPVPPMS